jgi:hypothetical protein
MELKIKPKTSEAIVISDFAQLELKAVAVVAENLKEVIKKLEEFKLPIAAIYSEDLEVQLWDEYRVTIGDRVQIWDKSDLLRSFGMNQLHMAIDFLVERYQGG